MAEKVLVTKSLLDDIVYAITEVNEQQATYTLPEMAAAIRELDSGGGEYADGEKVRW